MCTVKPLNYENPQRVKMCFQYRGVRYWDIKMYDAMRILSMICLKMYRDTDDWKLSVNRYFAVKCLFHLNKLL